MEIKYEESLHRYTETFQLLKGTTSWHLSIQNLKKV